MLIIARDMNSFSFRQLMDIYVEGNLENGQDQAPDATREQQIALGEEKFLIYLQEGFFQKPEAIYAIRQVGDCYVSALRLIPNRDGLLLEALETAPAYRCKGHAKALIREVQAWLGDVKLYSHVSKKNEASLRTHEVCEFQQYLNYSVRADGSVNHNTFTLCYDPAAR